MRKIILLFSVLHSPLFAGNGGGTVFSPAPNVTIMQQDVVLESQPLSFGSELSFMAEPRVFESIVTAAYNNNDISLSSRDSMKSINVYAIGESKLEAISDSGEEVTIEVKEGRESVEK